MNEKEVALELKHFSKKYGRNKNYSVKDLNFKVHKGEFHGFVGANGAGKTTTIKSIIGAYAKYEGEVDIFGKKNTLRESKARIGYIPEAADFPQGYSTHSYLKRMAMLSGMKSHNASKFAHEKLSQTGLSSVANRSPNNLSSGQKKKVLLAQALIHKPEVLIMDEPAANLDPTARKEFFMTLKNLTKTGATIFISSHILDELQKYIDSVTIIDGGAVAYSGPINEIGADRASVGNKTKWVMRTFKRELTSAVFQKLNIEHSLEGIFFHFIIDDQKMIELMNALFESKIQISSIVAEGTDLASIYDEFVAKGSLDVNGGEVVKGGTYD